MVNSSGRKENESGPGKDYRVQEATDQGEIE